MASLLIVLALCCTVVVCQQCAELCAQLCICIVFLCAVLELCLQSSRCGLFCVAASTCVSVLQRFYRKWALGRVQGFPALKVSPLGVRYFMSHHHLSPYNSVNIVILYQSFGLFTAENNRELS